MGMTCSMYRATAAELERLIENPDGLEGFLDRIEGAPLPVREVKPKGLLGLLYRLSPVTITEVDPDAATQPLEPPDPEQTIDIEKGWHGLHYLLTGSADEGAQPASFLVYGGEDLDDEGFGRALRPPEVRRFADHLARLSRAELERRFDPARMEKLRIYPEGWTREADDEDGSPLEWLLACFEEVRAFMGKAAVAGDGVIVRIS